MSKFKIKDGYASNTLQILVSGGISKEELEEIKGMAANQQFEIKHCQILKDHAKK